MMPTDSESLPHTMYFVTGNELTNFLFKGWNTNGQIAGIIGMCVAVLVATILLEALRTLMTFLSHRNSQTPEKQQTHLKIEPCKSKYVLEEEETAETQIKPRLATHAVLSVLHVVSTGLAYFLMLAVMTFNVWIAVSILGGTLVGYFFFGAIRDHITFSPQIAPPDWPREKTPYDKRMEMVSGSNGGYTNPSPDLHM